MCTSSKTGRGRARSAGLVPRGTTHGRWPLSEKRSLVFHSDRAKARARTERRQGVSGGGEGGSLPERPKVAKRRCQNKTHIPFIYSLHPRLSLPPPPNLFFFFLFGAVEWLNCACCALKTSRQPVHRCSLRPFPRCLRRNIFRSSRNMPFESHRRRETRFRRRGSSTRTGAVVCRPRNEAAAVAPK